MIAYILRRVLYALPILIGVNVITFFLFFMVNTPDDMARMHLGQKRVTQEAIQKWKSERGYEKPLLWNSDAGGSGKLTDTIFFQNSVKLFVFDFGRSDSGRDISYDISQRMWPSLAITVPGLLLGLLAYITFGLILAFFRATYVDITGVVICVIMMSISGLFYIIGGQYLISKFLHLVPISGYDTGLEAFKFVVLPVIVGLIGGIGASTRWYRTIFLEEMSKDYVRTARAKGLSNRQVLIRHALRNAWLPVLTLLGMQVGALLGGAVITETIFNWPGLGSLLIESIQRRDYPVVQGCVLLISLSYVLINLLTDLLYARVDPRIRLERN